MRKLFCSAGSLILIFTFASLLAAKAFPTKMGQEIMLTHVAWETPPVELVGVSSDVGELKIGKQSTYNDRMRICHRFRDWVECQ